MSVNAAGQTSQSRYSYSGADCRAYVYFPGRGDKIAPLESLHTISWSVHEAKGQARSLGFRGIRGLSRGQRTCAGSLIMTVIEDNPLAPLMDLMAELYLDPALRFEGWSMDWKSVGIGSGLDGTDFTRRLAPTLPAFNILLQYVAEGANWTDGPITSITDIPGAATLLVGCEIVDEGSVTSTSDSATETNYSFIAMDCKPLAKQHFISGGVPDNLLVQDDPGLNMAAELQNTLLSRGRSQAKTYKEQTGTSRLDLTTDRLA